MNDLRQAIKANLFAQIRHGLTGLLIRRLRQGLTIEAILAKIGWSQAQLWGRLDGEDQLTEREFAELVWALDAEIEISLRPWEEVEAFPPESA